MQNVTNQHRINLIWEVTQAFIAVGVVAANIYAQLAGLRDAALLSDAFFLIVGFYFGRTNHARPNG